ncbi:Trafficking protein particle complex subunit 12 [Armadillidium vulgare]|nr:Trafficking protein particle complex subunit 12 [Armadillidium vulgare]
MENKDKRNTASHYFKADSTTIFDELSKGQPEEKETFQNLSSPVEKVSIYFPSTSSFSYINTPTNQPVIETMNIEDNILSDITSSISHISLESDRIYDGWIPSDSTKEVLASIIASPGNYKVDKQLLVTPNIAIKEDFRDPIRNLLQNYLGEEAASQRRTLLISSVTQDDRGLRQLIANGCYHAAVNLTTQLLTVYGQGEKRSDQPCKHTVHSIQLWFTRIALLVKLRRFSFAEVECEPFGDLNSPDLYFEFYPEIYGGKKGSMIIENLMNGLTEDGSEMYKKEKREECIKVWKLRRLKVLYSLTRCAVSLKDFRLSSTLLQALLKEDKESTSGLFSALGRLCLNLGDINSAQEAFKKHLEHSPTGGNYDPVQGLLHSAFISCAKNDFGNAAQILEQAHKISPENPLVINNLGRVSNVRW